MRRHTFICCFAVLCGMGLSPLSAQTRPGRHTNARLPGAIVANAGQWRPEILFGDMLGTFAFTRDGVILAPRRAPSLLAAVGTADIARLDNADGVLHRFVHPSPRMRVEAVGAAGGAGNYYGGRDSVNWRPGLPLLAGVAYRDVWDSVDVVFTDDRGRLRMTLRMRPGAAARDVRIVSGGGDELGAADFSGGRDMAPASPPPAANPAAFMFGTEYSTYFSTASTNRIDAIKVDADGSVFISGWAPGKSYGQDATAWLTFVMHLDGDGRTIRYTTLYYPSPNYTMTPRNGYRSMNMCVRRNGNVVVSGCGREEVLHIPLTIWARETQANWHYGDVAYFFELNRGGQLNYASLFGSGPDPQMNSVISSMAEDSRGFLCIGGTFSGSPVNPGFRYMTPGTVDGASNRGTGNFVVKLYPALDSVRWGTRVGPYPAGGRGNSGAMTLDSLDNVIFTGFTTESLDGIPIVNPTYPPYDGMPGGRYLQKLTPDADTFIVSTHLPGENWDPDMEGTPRIGPGNTIAIVGTTNEADIPVVNAMRGYHGASDGYFMHLSPRGEILRAFYIGGAGYDGLWHADFDRAGNVHLYGWSESMDFPLVNPLVPYDALMQVYNMLVVVKEGTDSLLLSTPWNVSNDAYNQSVADDLLQVRPSGFVYFAGWTDRDLPVFNPLRDHPLCKDTTLLTCRDNFITRLFLPFDGQDALRCTMSGTDSLRFETTRGITLGREFTVTAHVRNASQKDTAFNGALTFTLPPRVSINSALKDTRWPLPAVLRPGDTASISINLRVDTILADDRSFLVRAFADFDPRPVQQPGERPFSRATYNVPVERIASPVPLFTCAIDCPDSLRAATGNDSLAGNPFPVRFTVRNSGTREFTLSGMRLELPAGAVPWLAAVPADDVWRPGGVLAPGAELTRDWVVHAANHPAARDIDLGVAVYDSIGVRVHGCTATLHRQALAGLRCAVAGPAEIRFDAANGGYSGAPFTIDCTLLSLLDTASTETTARIDFSRAPHLRLAAGETVSKSLSSVPAHGDADARWRIEVIPHPAGEVTDTLLMHFTGQGWPEERTCMHELRIIPPRIDVSCMVSATPIAITPDGRHAPDTARITWTLTNAGEIPTSGGTVRLAMTGDTAWCPDPLERALPPIGPNQNVALVWRLVPPSSAFARSVAIRIVESGPAGTIADCGTVLDIPHVDPALACVVAAPDTLHYDKATDAYAPDPAGLILTVVNRVDTAAAIEARLDLAGAPHLALAPGETGRAARIVVAPHAVMRAAFRISVAQPPDSAVTEYPLIAAAAIFGSTMFESRCQAPITLEKHAPEAGVTAPPRPASPTLTCSPNPVRPGGVLEVRYTSAVPVHLRLLDALGREALAAATPQTARMSLALPSNLASGLYFVEATSREGRMVRGVAVVP